MNFSKYKYKTELHSHSTPGSICSEIPPESLVKIYSQLGYTSIVLSNHFFPEMKFYGDKDKTITTYLKDYYEAKECGKKYGINVILGCEIRFNENFNDYLLFGIDENTIRDAYDFIDGDVKTFSKWFRNKSRLIIQAHPFRNGMTPIPPEMLDGIEVFNVHPGHNSRIGRAAQYAKEHDFTVTCGTDYHHKGHEGLCALLTKKPVTNSFELAQVLRSRDYLFEISGNIILPYGK